ncbi:DEAD/DEAH box helicase [Anaerophaga thermohalophila]|jgi:replicative superfamily II helicase|uniref:DEAD/DEAH box helicase n=1 Tax=Anaerophaga thermohalophila TaxID=177400 RepID=UPI000237B94F|nr:DEAD/DEAH box helicase [Anaerophaga thermohalophila]
MSIELKYNHLERAYPDMLTGIGALIQKGKLSGRFESVELSEEDIRQLEKAKELCELKIIELWDSRDSQQFKALCATYFDIASQLSALTESEYYIYEQFKLIAFGYLGEHWHFVRQYLKSRMHINEELTPADDWNQRLLTRSFKAILGLILKENWKDVDKAVQQINALREEQNDFEGEFLNKVNEESRPYGAAEVVSLYHFAKSIEILGHYLTSGKPTDAQNKIHYHLELSREFAQKSGNISLSLLFQFHEAFAIKMLRNTIWYTTSGINQWVTQFNKFITEKEDKGIFELLYPQRESIITGQLLNPAHKAIVVTLPTSSGKTMIAEYRILQALNEFKEKRRGWVAYVAPTRSLVNQVFNQLKNELGSIGLKVEKASGAIELDGFEQHLIEDQGDQTEFDVLVTTYEKLNLLVRQGLGSSEDRPLVLTVVDEAHNIEDQSRGLNLEFLLSTIKNDCPEANFLLMTPDISNSGDVANWLAPDRGQVINLELDWWQPNERVVGAIQVNGKGKTYDFSLRTLHTQKGSYEIGDSIPLCHFENADEIKSKIYGSNGSKKKLATSLASQILDLNSPIIVLASTINETFDIADKLSEEAGKIERDADVDLVKRLVASELGDDFPLVKYLDRRIAVHSAAIPDEIRILIEDLMSKKGKLRALVATTTIAQGINFPVSAVVMGSYIYRAKGYSYDMPVRDFWNLAGRVGRAGQDQMGWVGIALKNDSELPKVIDYVGKASEKLLSQLVNAIEKALHHVNEDFGRWLWHDARWTAVLQYISHLRKQIREQDEFLAQIEQKLQDTFGYSQLPQDKRNILRNKIRGYAAGLTRTDAERSDQTGFSTVSVRQMIGKLANAGLTPNDWNRNQLFSEQNQSMKKLVGIMMNTYEIREAIEKLSPGDNVLDRTSISRLIIDWVNGKDIAAIANRIYPSDDKKSSIQNTTKALYNVVANAATWGLAALQQMPTSGSDWENLSDIEKKRMANLPAYLHYGVNTDEGVLMRKNNVPRSVANRLGELYGTSVEGQIFSQPSSSVADWIGQQNVETWNKVRPANSQLSGEDYKKIWMKLNGIK